MRGGNGRKEGGRGRALSAMDETNRGRGRALATTGGVMEWVCVLGCFCGGGTKKSPISVS